MSYEFKRDRRGLRGFGDDRLARAATPLPVEETSIVRETAVATTRSQYEVAPTMIQVAPELIERQQTVPTVPTAVVRQDSLIFPSAGWAPVAPSAPAADVSPYVTAGAAPVVVEPLTVEPVDSVAMTSRAVTAYPLDSQMSAADASLTEALQTRGLPSQGTVTTKQTNAITPESVQITASAPTEIASRSAQAYTAPATDSLFTDPLRNPANYVDSPVRPDMEPDYTMLPKTAVAPAPARTAYILDAGLTELNDRVPADLPPQPPTEGSIASRTRPTTCPVGFFMDENGVCYPEQSRPAQSDGRSIETCASGFYWDAASNGCLATPDRASDAINVDEETDTLTFEDDTFSEELNTEPPVASEEEPLPSEADASMMAQECNAKGGVYVYDPNSGQNICQMAQPVVAAPSETPWLLIGAGLLAAWFLLKE